MARSGPAALAAAFALGATSAWADITPEELWQAWQDNAAAQGQKVTAESTELVGDTLTLSGITFAQDANGGSFLIEQIQFTDTGDGSVAVVLPDEFPLILKIPAAAGVEGATATDMTVTVAMPDGDITASGVPAALTYAMDLPKLDITADVNDGAMTAAIIARMTGVTGTYAVEAAESGLNQIQDFAAGTLDLSVKTSGTPDQAVTVAFSITDLGGKSEFTGIPATGMADLETALNQGMTLDLSASYGIGSFDIAGQDAGVPIKVTGSLGGGGLTMGFAANRFAYDASGKAISINASGSDSTSSEPFTLSATLASTATKVEMTGANWTNSDAFEAALKAGLKMSGGIALGPTAFDFAGGAAERKTTVTAALGGLETSFAMDGAQMHYDLGSKALAVKMSSPDLPMPEASVDLTELALDFGMPLSKSDTPAPFNLLAKLVDLDVADALWAMLDPAGMVPHDPATLIIDTGGTTTLTSDLLADPMALAAGTDAPPLLNSLDLTQILLRLAGAEVTAQGAFTFDNTDMMTIPGMPAPTGKIDIKATGLNTLADTLVAMGLLPEDQLMQGRMMISMFANTATDKDEITSTLEFKDKHFFANGQQLQ